MTQCFNNNVAKVTIKNKDGQEIEFNCAGVTINQSVDYINSTEPLDFTAPCNYELEIRYPNKTIYEGESKMNNNEPLYSYARFTFPSNRQRFYTYKVGPEVQEKLKLHNEYYVLTEKGYNYKLTPLKFVGYTSNIPQIQLTEIIIVWDKENPSFHSEYPQPFEMDSSASLSFMDTIRALNIETTLKDYDPFDFSDNCDISSEEEEIDSIVNKLSELSKINILDKGEDNMNSKIFNGMEFGKIEATGRYAMTLKGIAFYSIATSGEDAVRTYVQYNPETNEIEDVTPLVISEFSAGDFLYKMPVAISNVKVGDIVFSNSNPVFVKEVKENNELVVVDPETKKVDTILLAKNIFGFNYITKVVNLMENFNLNSSATADQPFGNLLPLMMISGKNTNMKDLIPLILLSNGASMGADFMNNPMMMYFLFSGEKNNDLLPFLLMSNGTFGNNTPIAN